MGSEEHYTHREKINRRDRAMTIYRTTENFRADEIRCVSKLKYGAM